MKFNVDYPSEMTAPKGLYIPKLEDIQQAVKLAEMVVSYTNPGYEDGDEFTIMITDEINLSEGYKLISCANTGEGVTLYPSPGWDMNSVLSSILFAIFEG